MSTIDYDAIEERAKDGRYSAEFLGSLALRDQPALVARARLADELAAELTDVRAQLAAKDELLTLRTAALDRVSKAAERLQRQVWDADERDLSEREADSNALETARERVAALEVEVERLSSIVTEAALETYTPDGSERFVSAFHEALRARKAAEARLDAVRALAREWQALGRTDVAWHWVSIGDRLAVEVEPRALDSDATASEPTVERITDTPWDEVGGPMWLDREQWGIVIDALVQHRGHADARKAANSESNSDVRARMCADLIQRINAAAAHLPARQQGVDRTDTPGGQR